MNRSHLWKLLLVVFVVFWSLYEVYPPQPRDLIDEFRLHASLADTNQAAQFNGIVERARQLQKERPDNSFGNLIEAVGTNDLSGFFPQLHVANERNPNRSILQKIQKAAAGKIKLGLDLQGGTAFLVKMDTSKLLTSDDKSRVLGQGVEVMRKRVDKFGVAEPLIQPVGDDRMLIQLPGLSQAELDSARNQIQRPAFLEFRMVHENNDELVSQGLSAPGYERMKITRKTRDGQEVTDTFLVKKKAEHGLTGKSIRSAGVYRDPVSSEPKISFAFDAEGGRTFADITRQNVGRFLAIVLDGELYSAPRIHEPITQGRGEISGSFDFKEAFELANVLENPLEAPVSVEQEYRVEASLGRDAIESGVKSALYGTAAVAVFMLVYYFRAGIVANIALVLNVIILMGVLCSIGATLTLPGIAGIVLTVGMAVDANVLIFERIREEAAAGKSLRGAIAAGYDKAFGTIFDSNLTTLIASVILYFMGTGPIQGFGATLTIGVSVSMFTALLVTRLIFDWLVANNWLKSLKMLSLIKGAKYDFLRWAWPAFITSWAIIFVGIGYGALVRGKSVMGVDFAGGDRLTLNFKNKVQELEKIREVIVKLKVGDPLIQYQKDIGAGKETLQITTAFDSGDKVLSSLEKEFPQAGFKQVGLYRAGPTVGAQIMTSAVVSVLLSLFGILVYVAFRYEFSFAVGAVTAVVHDVLMSLGVYFLVGRELNATMVAALLTIIGFSINDTIVIFDRIREDLKLGLRGTFSELINHALNRTLSRTIITSGTVFLATGSLYVFGGGVVNDFAFTFLVGIITGTYSSIYIASALVLWWHKGERPKTAASQVVMDQALPARV